MPNKTANYNLVKPLGSEHYDINVHNGNMDIIDEELKKVTESNNKRIDEIENEFKDSSLDVIKTDVSMTPLTGCSGGFVNIEKVQGKTEVINGKLVSTGEEIINTNNNLFTQEYKNYANYKSENNYIWLEIKLEPHRKYIINVNAIESLLAKGYYYRIGNNKAESSSMGGWLVHTGYDIGKQDITFTTDSTGIMYLGFYGSDKTNFDNMMSKLKPTLYTIDYRIEILTKTKNLAKFPKSNLEVINTLNYRCLPISLTKGKTYTVSGTFKAPVDGRQFYARLFNVPTYNTTSLIDIMSANNVNNFSFNIQYSPVYLGICRDPDTTMTDDDFKYIAENLKLQIEEGDKATPYVPYNEGKTEILSSTPWRQWDSTDNNGVKTIGSAQIVLNGNETYGKSSFTLQNYSVFYFKLSNAYKYLGQYDSSNFTCDKFKKQNWIDMYLNKIPEEAISIGDDGFMYIKINNSKLNTQDEAGFKTWLASNPLTVVYQLANPAIENPNKTLDLKAYDNLIVNAGSIQPEITYSYPKNTGERFVTIENTVNSVKGTVEDINKNLDEKIKEINLKTSNIKVPVTKVNGKDGEINLSANDIKNSEGKTIETKLNELFQSANSSLQSANSGKAAIAGAVGGVTGQNSFDEIANYIASKRNEIGSNLGAGDYATMQKLNDWTSQRKIDLANQLVSKGVLASASENLGALISKVANINTGLQYSTGSVIITVPADYSGGGPGSASISRIPISVNSLNFKPKTVFYYVDGNSDANNRLNVDYNSTATSGPKVSYARWTGQFSDNNDSVAEKLRINHNDGFKAKFSDFLIQGDTFNEILTNTGFSVDISFADSRPYNGGKANVTWLAIG